MVYVIGIVAALIILFGFLCYKKAPPTEAIVVTGFGLSKPKVVCGKGTFVLPVLQRADRLNMRLLKIDVKTPETGVKTKNGVSLWIDSVVTIQVYSENSTVLDEEVKASGLKDAKAYIMSRQQADADLYRRQKEAEAKKYEAERAAEAQKFSKQQEAEGIELVGKAEAEAIRQKGLAEAEAMKQKAEAYKQYNDAAVAEMLIKVLPDVAKSVAQPLSSIDKVSIIGGDASGVSGVSGNVPILMAQTMQTVKEATGIDMGEIVRANSIQAKTDRNINIMNQGEQPVNSEKEGGVNAMERVEGGYLIHEKKLNGEEVTHFRPDMTEEEKAIMKDKKAKD